MTPIHCAAAILLSINAYKLHERHFENLKKPGNTLVVCSNRNSEPIETHFVESLWSSKKRKDLSYASKDDYITLDIKPAINSGKHIVGNAATVRITDPNIRTLYIERPWTYDPIAKKTDFNMVKSYLDNLLPSLRPGGEVLIEWHPFTILEKYYDPLNPKLKPLPTRNLNSDKAKNPFTGFFDLNIYFPALFLP